MQNKLRSQSDRIVSASQCRHIDTQHALLALINCAEHVPECHLNNQVATIERITRR